MDLELRQMGINHSSCFVPSVYSFLPPHLKKENNPTFITGFLTIFSAMHDVLAAPAQYSSITPKVILARAFELDFIAAKHYITKGARVEHALDALLGGAEDQSPRGDGTFDELFEGEGGGGGTNGGTHGGFGSLPECAIDLESGIVRRQFGVVEGRR